MGLLRAFIYFILGNLFLGFIEKIHTDDVKKQIKSIPVLGPMFGDTLVIYVKENSCTIVVLFMSFLAFIL